MAIIVGSPKHNKHPDDGICSRSELNRLIETLNSWSAYRNQLPLTRRLRPIPFLGTILQGLVELCLLDEVPLVVPPSVGSAMSRLLLSPISSQAITLLRTAQTSLDIIDPLIPFSAVTARTLSWLCLVLGAADSELGFDVLAVLPLAGLPQSNRIIQSGGLGGFDPLDVAPTMLIQINWINIRLNGPQPLTRWIGALSRDRSALVSSQWDEHNIWLSTHGVNALPTPQILPQGRSSPSRP
jgi:hypothetical protein